MCQADSFETLVGVFVVASRFWQRIGIVILRGNRRSFHRHLVNKAAFVESGSGLFRGVAGLSVAEYIAN